MSDIHVERIHPFAKLPTRGSDEAAGWDLYACDNLIVPARRDSAHIVAVSAALGLVVFMCLHSAILAGAAMILVIVALKPVLPLAVVPTGIRVAIPRDSYARIAPRSGLAARSALDVGAGVVDSDYRGELKVVLFNNGTSAFRVERGARVAQLIVEKIDTSPIVESTLSSTSRGNNGFGSSGL